MSGNSNAFPRTAHEHTAELPEAAVDSPVGGGSSIDNMTVTDAINLTEFVERYVQVWNDPDPAARRHLVRALWSPDAVEFTDANEFRGHDALDGRVTAAHTRFVEEGGSRFVPAAEPAAHHDALLMTVEMGPAAGGQAVWACTILAFLDSDGRIEREYQFGRDLPTA